MRCKNTFIHEGHGGVEKLVGGKYQNAAEHECGNERVFFVNLAELRSARPFVDKVDFSVDSRVVIDPKRK